VNKTPEGDLLFSFVVIADTHMNQKEDYSSSPYPCNVLANARTRRVIAEINRLDAELVVHLGGIVNPVPELPTYAHAAGHFKRLVEDLEPPLHVVPGNHDVGDKPVSWAAGIVTEDNLALYESHFGRHYFSFDHRDIHFVIINSSIINSGLEAEGEQREWLEADLAGNAAKRCYFFIHYPPYVSSPGEPSSYDNLDEPGRGWLLGLVRRYAPEALFCGHVHNFWYDIYAQTETYILPSTAFVRHDYSEFFRVGPTDQHGRNDEAKLGYFIVRVYERGHVAENVRTYGKALAPQDKLPPSPMTVASVHGKEKALLRVGVDLRHPWAEEVDIPPSGALDEFERKRARNDYPLLALWEMGVRRLRVPLQDLIDERVSGRMAMLKRLGHTFQVYVYGTPSDAALSILTRRARLVDRLEVVVDWAKVDSALALVESIKNACDVRVYLSRVNRRDDAKHRGGRYHHLISHGFTLAEGSDLLGIRQDKEGLLDGFVFRVAREQSPWALAQAAGKLSKEIGARACLYVKSSSASPAETFADDAENAARIAEAVLSAAAHTNVEVILDTFADADRGYFARTGLVDRRYNPRTASKVLSSLCALLNEAPHWRESARLPAGCIAGVEGVAGNGIYLLDGKHTSGSFEDPDRASQSRRWVNLGTGRIWEDPNVMIETPGLYAVSTAPWD